METPVELALHRFSATTAAAPARARSFLIMNPSAPYILYIESVVLFIIT